MPFGQEVRVGSAVRTELDGQGVCVLGQGLIADVHVAEVAVFEQVDRVEQVDVRVQAQGGDDLSRRQAE